MVADKENTEEKILGAAKEVFVEKGKDGARMQEIADKAGINKSLLHYYYRSKDKLFSSVFKFAFKHFVPRLTNIFNEEEDFFEQLRKFISTYIDIISKNPFIPMFILNEINKRDTSFVVSAIKNAGVNINELKARVQKEKDKGLIEDVVPEQLFVNILAMCIFPFVGRPLIQQVIFEGDSKKYDEFLEKRKSEVADFVINSIKKK